MSSDCLMELAAQPTCTLVGSGNYHHWAQGMSGPGRRDDVNRSQASLAQTQACCSILCSMRHCSWCLDSGLWTGLPPQSARALEARALEPPNLHCVRLTHENADEFKWRPSRGGGLTPLSTQGPRPMPGISPKEDPQETWGIPVHSHTAQHSREPLPTPGTHLPLSIIINIRIRGGDGHAGQWVWQISGAPQAGSNPHAALTGWPQGPQTLWSSVSPRATAR